jgi:protein-disulfide isomerase
VNPDAVVQPIGRRLAARRVRRDDKDLVTVKSEMLHHPKHRVGDAVDIREEGLCDDRNAHMTMVASAAVGKVASGDTTRKVLVPSDMPAPNTGVHMRVFCAQGRAVDMRIPRAALAATAAVLLGAVGCTSQVTGTATMDPTKPPLGLSEDGYGIVAGYPDAPVQIELYTEPQCTHCADLQAAFGDDIKRHINLGDLAVTYRPVTFLDDPSTDKHSARVANALFLAVGAPEATDQNNMASGPEFQTFVEDLWAHQNPGGPGPSDSQMAKMAEESGLPEDVAGRIGDGDTADQVDVDQMSAYNYGALVGIDPITTGTPTVYDLTTQEKVDIHDNDWLDNLLSTS